MAQGNAWRRLLNLIMQLRKVVNHPFMMPDSEPRGDGTSTLPELLDASGEWTVRVWWEGQGQHLRWGVLVLCGE